jgi:serine/threonine-protein kinase
LNREVAVKVLSRDQSADDETLRRFRNEAQSTARLDHDNIARVHYVGEDRGVHYIVFEFIEGVNIRDLVEQKGPLPLDEALSYTYQIAEALEHASQRNVIHRDIKPSNVLITPAGKAKLVDMGLARLHQVATADDDLTASGVTLGTFDYISPEQARDPRSADVRSDLYSLGCSFYYMLTGRPPFPDGTVLQKLLQHQGDHAPDPRGIRPELPLDVTRIVACLLAKNPAHRYQQPSELIDELAVLGDRLGMQLSASRAVRPQPRVNLPIARWRHHLPWAVPLTALFVIVVVMELVWTSKPDESAGLQGVARPVNGLGPRAGAESSSTNPSRSKAPETRSAPDRSDAAADQVPVATDADAENPKPPVGARAGQSLPNAPGVHNTPGENTTWFGRLLKSVGADVDLETWAARASAAAKAQSDADQGEEAANDAATSPDGAAPVAGPRVPARRENLLVVGDEAGPGTYATLNAACSNAKSGDAIELRYTGRRPEKPITISNKKLTIRAGQDYEPIVAFRPEPVGSAKYLPSMLNVAGGQLSVSDVHWELDMPRDAPADLALFETRGAEIVQFQRCTFTIRNASPGQTAYHTGVAFFDIKAPPGLGSMAKDPSAVEEQIVTVSLQDCVARGEAAMLRANELQAVRLKWDNGLLATSERLLVAAGGPSQPRQGGHVQLYLNHVTAMVKSGLALMTNREDAPYQVLTEINCDNSIVASTAKPPLIEQRGSDSIQEYLTRLQWSGDHDFFDGFDIFWQILNTASETNSKQQRFDDWQNFWRGQSRWQIADKNGVRWRGLPPVDRPYHSHTPSDYALDPESAGNLALGAASDGLDAGCVARRLPRLPADEPAAAHPAPRNLPALPRNLDGS